MDVDETGEQATQPFVNSGSVSWKCHDREGVVGGLGDDKRIIDIGDHGQPPLHLSLPFGENEFAYFHIYFIVT